MTKKDLINYTGTMQQLAYVRQQVGKLTIDN